MLSKKKQQVDYFVLTLEDSEKKQIIKLLLDQLLEGSATISEIENNLGYIKLPNDLFESIEESILKMKKNMHSRQRMITGYDEYSYKVSESVIYYNALGVVKFFQGQLESALKAFNRALLYSNVYENAVINLCIVQRSMIIS